MKRAVIGVLIGIWTLITLGAILFLGISLSGGGVASVAYFSVGTIGQELLKEESFGQAGVDGVELDVSFENVHLMAAEGSEFRVRQYGLKNRPKNSYFNAEVVGGKLQINTGRVISIGLFTFNNDRVILEVPQEWIGSMRLRTSSGSIKVYERFSFYNTEFSTSSGNITLEGGLESSDLLITCSSGNISVSGDLKAEGSLNSTTASGTQKFSGTVKAREGTFSASSGGIRFSALVSCEGMLSLRANSGTLNAESAVEAGELRAKSSSGSIKLGNVTCKNYEISASSGNVRLGTVTGSGTVNTTSGSVELTLHENAVDLRVNASSGGVTVRLPRGMSFTFEGRTSSGNINTDFDLLYRDERHKNAVAEIGEDAKNMLISIETTSGSIKMLYSRN